MNLTGKIYTLIFILFLFACDDANETEPGSDDIVLKIDKTEDTHLLMIKSSADKSEVPVYITFPVDRSAPLKAVFVMHGSGGPWNDKDLDGDGIAEVCNVGQPSSQTRQWRDLLNENGYAAIFADSYSPRGTCENEGVYKNPPYKFDISGTFIRNRDAYDVLELLRSLRWSDNGDAVIDMNNVAILGFSDGGTSVISTLYDVSATPAGWTWKQSFSGTTYTAEILPPVEKPAEGGFKAGVLFYPGAYHNGYYGSLCSEGKGIYSAYCDMLVHIAEEDPLTDNTKCLVNTMAFNGGGEVTVYEYAGADHGFDGSDEPHSTLARTRTIDFLKSVLK